MMGDFSIHTEHLKEIPKGVLIVLAGSIDAKTVPAFQENLNKLRDDGILRYIMDFEGVKYVNSTGLGYLVNLADSLEPHGGGVCLVRVALKVKVVFDMLGLNAFFKIFTSRKEALDYFGTDLERAIASAAPEDAGKVMEEAAGAQTVMLKVSPVGPKTAPKPIPAAAAPVAELKPAPVASAQAPAAAKPPAPAAVVAAPAPAAPTKTTDCPVCKSVLLVSDPSMYKCPRCGILFNLQKDGKAAAVPRRKFAPVQLVLASIPECVEGLGVLVTRVSKKAGFSQKDSEELSAAVTETANVIIRHSYKNNEQCTFQVLISPGASELSVKLSDYGARMSVDTKDAEGHIIFDNARRMVDAFDVKPHPKSGNIMSLTKKIR
jgi:anti-anti-sigma factor